MILTGRRGWMWSGCDIGRGRRGGGKPRRRSVGEVHGWDLPFDNIPSRFPQHPPHLSASPVTPAFSNIFSRLRIHFPCISTSPSSSRISSSRAHFRSRHLPPHQSPLRRVTNALTCSKARSTRRRLRHLSTVITFAMQSTPGSTHHLSQSPKLALLCRGLLRCRLWCRRAGRRRVRVVYGTRRRARRRRIVRLWHCRVWL